MVYCWLRQFPVTDILLMLLTDFIGLDEILLTRSGDVLALLDGNGF